MISGIFESNGSGKLFVYSINQFNDKMIFFAKLKNKESLHIVFNQITQNLLTENHTKLINNSLILMNDLNEVNNG